MEPSVVSEIPPYESADTVRACGSCRWYRPDTMGALFADCAAVSQRASVARRSDCQDGRLWEPRPRRRGFFPWLREVLFGA